VRASVHRHDPEVHDDLDLSYHLHPGDTVVHDRHLVVGISARPLRDPTGMVVRFRRATHTMRIHGTAERPTPRWRRRILSRRAPNGASGAASSGGGLRPPSAGSQYRRAPPPSCHGQHSTAGTPTAARLVARASRNTHH